MFVNSFAEMYKLFNKVEDSSVKASLSMMLLNKLGLHANNASSPAHRQQNTDKELEPLSGLFNQTTSEQQHAGSVIEDFNLFDRLSRSYAVSRCFDARVSHQLLSCDYFILFELLRHSAQRVQETTPQCKTIEQAISDNTLFDELFAMPALRLAISYLKPSAEKDSLILADLILAFFTEFDDLSTRYSATRAFSSAAAIADGTQPIHDKIKDILAFKVRRLAVIPHGIHALQLAMSGLNSLKQALRRNLAELSLKNSAHRLTVEKIIADKSAMAYGYHHNKTLNRCPFDELMKNDPQTFAHHLKKSAWLRGNNAEKLPFFSKLTSFEGPMYKVFTQQELVVIKQWALSEQPEAIPAAHETATASLFPTLSLPERQSQYRRETNIRRFFHQLMTSDDHDYLDWQSEKFTDAWLSRASAKIRQIPFKKYSNSLLDQWFLQRAKMQIDDYAQGRMASNKSKQEVIEEALHLAPMILLDGAWLNHYSHPQLLNDDIGEILFEIYADEIGNGRLEKNHPIIYRNLITEMGIELPDIASVDFSTSDYFDDEDFQVPVFWLSISRFPKKYLPETLGLNLAMELSGVGGAYNQARDELKQYGFNTLFVDLHNSIDNAASGHSANALNAIKIYMDAHTNDRNPKLMQLLWERVWTGYLSLSPPKKSLLFPLVSHRYHV